jgi:hypothetical protein
LTPLTGLLSVIAGLGVVISSAITIVAGFNLCTDSTHANTVLIRFFFPQSIEGEIAIRQALLEKRLQKATGTTKRHVAGGTYALRSSLVSAQKTPRHDHFGNAPSSFRYYESREIVCQPNDLGCSNFFFHQR